MLSTSHDFGEFLDKIKHLDYADILLTANAEATAAERSIYKSRADSAADDLEACRRYAKALKDFIYYLRNGVKPHSIRAFDVRQFEGAREEWWC